MRIFPTLSSQPVFAPEGDAGQPVVTATPAAEPIPSDGSDIFDIDANMAEFFGHTLGDPAPAAVEPAPTPVAEPNPSPVQGFNPAPASPTPPAQPTPNAEPAASANQGGGEPEVDPNLIASILLGTTPPAVAPAKTENAPAAPAAPASSASPADTDDKPYMPIVASEVKIPPAVLQTIFNSEDPVQQEQALVQLLAGWGNAIISMADARVRDHYGPRFSQQVQQQQVASAQAARTEADFYGSYADLKDHPALVAKVAAAVAAQNPGAAYPAVKDTIGRTARALAKQMGLTLTGGPAAAPAPAQPFVAGGARPASHGQPAGFDPNDPGQMVEQLADAGFTF